MTQQTENYYYGKGRVSVATRDPVTKVLGLWIWAMDVSAFAAKPTVQMVQHKESYSGQSALAKNFPSERALQLDMTLDNWSPENLALALYGTINKTTTGTVTAESLPATVAIGDDVRLANPGVSALVLTDSTPTTPKTLVLDTDYTIDPNFGRISILNVTGYVQPFKAAYSFAQRTDVGIFSQGQPDISVLYEGINLAENNAGVIAEFYKVAPAPLQDLMLITTGNDTAGMAITAGVLIDPSKPATGPLGQFGRITTVGI
jgi:hypothetical protein